MNWFTCFCYKIYKKLAEPTRNHFPMDSVFIGIHTIGTALGCFINIFLCHVAIFHSPPIIKTYSICLINTAITNIGACITGFLRQQRIIPSGDTLFYVSYGPCVRFGPQFCLNVWVHRSTLASCFPTSFQFWRTSPLPHPCSLAHIVQFRIPLLCDDSPWTFQMQTSVLHTHRLHSFLHTNAWNFSARPGCSSCPGTPSGKIPTVQHDWAHSHRSTRHYHLCSVVHYHSHDCYQYSNYHWDSGFSEEDYDIVSFEGSGYDDEFKEFARAVAEGEWIGWTLWTSNFQTLTFQATLPLFYLIGVFCFFTAKLGIWSHPLLEFSITATFLFIPILTPISSLVYVTPYRQFVQRIFGRRRLRATNSVNELQVVSVITDW